MNKVDKYDISYSVERYCGKDVFVFVNHKTALFCWAKIKEKLGPFDVITFDSHNDYFGGYLHHYIPPGPAVVFGSKFKEDKTHFSKSDEFMDWDLLDDSENKIIVSKNHHFLKTESDNHIDVAFMKDVIKNVYSYHHMLQGNESNTQCDDINDDIHYFNLRHVGDFESPQTNFVLDVDLDFFVYHSDGAWNLIEETDLNKYLDLISSLFLSENCVGLTIALEPDFCETSTSKLINSPVIWKNFSKTIYPNLEKKAHDLLKN